MSDLNTLHNRAVWFDIPVADVARATAFYAAVLAVPVHKAQAEGIAFSVLDHDEGNGGCLIPNEKEIRGDGGLLVYLNVQGRIQDAVEKVKEHGGRILEGVHAIGPHGFRALILDSEGNRVALHSPTDP